MKQKLLKLMLLLAVGMMGVSAWGADQVYKTALFGSTYNSAKVGSYTDTFDATNSGFTVSLQNFNNNNNGWDYVKCGRKNNASVATIITKAAIDEAITKVDVTIDAITAAKVNSIKLYTSTDKSTWTEAGSYDASTGTQSVAVASPTANLYYKVEFDCASGSSNGLVTVSKVEYYKAAGGGGGSSAVATTTTISPAGITNTDVYVGTAAGSLSASVTETESGDDVDGATVTWSGNNDAVATINATTGVVTLVAAGTVTFTANYAGVADEYASSSDTYEMTVVDNTPDPYMWVETSLSALTASDVFVIVGYNGGTYAMTNDNGTTSAPAAVSVTISNNKISGTVAANLKWNISGNATDGYTFYPNGDDENWLYCTNNNNGLRVGTGTDKTFVVNSDYLYNSGQTRYVGIYNSQDWRSYTSINSNIKDQTFKFYKAVDATYTRTVTAGNWGTICLPYDATVEGATLYTIAGKEITGSEVTALVLAEAASVEAGKPYIFKATASDVVATFTGTTYTAAGNVNGLYGTYAAIAANTWDTYVSGDLYLMTTSKVQAADKETSSLAANRAYIAMSEVSVYTGSEVKGIRLGFDGTETPTGINGLTPALSKGEGVIYNLNGQRVNSLQKGINIVGGKKVLVK